MTELCLVHARPQLRTPVLLVGLDGWVDAGDVLGQTLDTICSRPMVLVAEWDTDELIDYRARRPTVRIQGGINVGLAWPRIELLATHDLDGRDVLVLRGPEPDRRWKAFTGSVLDLARQLGVRLVVPFGAYPAAAPHTRPVQLSATGTTPLAVERVGFVSGDMEVPAGIHAAIERAAADRGVPSVGVWAPVPHYAARDPYAPSVLALLRGVEELAERRFDTTDVEGRAATSLTKLDAQMAADDDVAQMVRQLETHTDRLRASLGDVPSGDDLAAELQRYLENPGT